jgi:tRNA A37 methylthiotransferase MiaB
MSSPITIGLVQLNNTALNFLPYTAGLLQAYVIANTSDSQRYRFLAPVSQALTSLAEAAVALQAADVVGFSLFVWNVERSLAIARVLKQARPDRWVVVGGPHVPDQAEAFLRAHPEIDVCCHGEGEQVFLDLLAVYPQRDWRTIPGTSWLDAEGGFHHLPRAPRRKDLAVLPSPYLMGLFDELVKTTSSQPWAAMWETNRGCPFSCSFCDWGSATGAKVNAFDVPRLQHELAWFAAHRLGLIFCCDANFGILSRDLELAQTAADYKMKTGYPGALIVQNTKNMTERAYQVHKTLIRAGLDASVTLSVQSVHAPVLKAVKRQNISLKTYQELHQRLTEEGIQTYTDVIIGLPEETYTSFTAGIASLIEGGQHHSLHFFNASILPNAEMAEPAYREQYGLITQRVATVYLHTAATPPPDGIEEYQELIIATRTLSLEDWARCRAFAWLTLLLYYGQELLRPALLLLHIHYGVSYRALLDALLDVPQTYPTLFEISRFLWDCAAQIQAGGYEYVTAEGPAYNGIWWSPDELLLRRLLSENRIGQFFDEMRAWLAQWLGQQGILLDRALLQDLIEAGKIKLKLTYHPLPLEIPFHYNVPEACTALRRGIQIPLREEPWLYYKDWPGLPHTLARRRVSPYPFDRPDLLP